jgi:hypothetical protein
MYCIGLASLVFWTPGLFSQQVYKDTVIKKNIKTTRLHKVDDALSYPVMTLYSPDHLLLSFDELGNNAEDYYYTIQHCKVDWTASNLFYNDYIEGFEENFITDYEYSDNTTHSYIYYSLKLPNEDVVFKKSGNYVVIVYLDSPDNPVLIRRFFVQKNVTNVNVNIKRPVNVAYIDTKQEIDIEISGVPGEISNPYNDIQLVITKNNIWRSAIKELKPKFMRENKIIYDYQKQNLFDGGNEYRYFNCKDIYHASENIEKIEYDGNHHHFYLKPDYDLSFRSYTDMEDINGSYVVQYENEEKSEVLSDYVFVHFTLAYEAPVLKGDLYIDGELTLWNFNNENKMTYNYDNKQYEAMLLLKQGFYNYQYVLHHDTITNSAFIGGSHWQTENDYVIFVYESQVALQYDKLLKVKVVNSQDYF